MKSYTVHRPRRTAGNVAAETDATVFIKEGICWPALVAPVIWLFYRMMWLVLVCYLAIAIGGSFLISLAGLGEAVSVVFGVALQVALATEGNDLRRWTLRRRGWEFVGTAFGPSLFEAELQYFRGWTERVSSRQEAAAAAEPEVAFRTPPAATAETRLTPRAGPDPASA